MPWGRHSHMEHLKHVRKCPRCGKIVRGNAYFIHKKSCMKKHNEVKQCEYDKERRLKHEKEL